MSILKRDGAVGLNGGSLETVVGANTTFRGCLRSDGNIRIEGILQGEIETTGNVVIGPSAQVIANVSANAVQVWGQVRGDIDAQGRLEILSAGKVWGSISVGALMIDEGGLFRGQCVMSGKQVGPIDLADERRLLEAAHASSARESQSGLSKLTASSKVEAA